MSGQEGKKVRGNQKGQKVKGSGALNPLVAVMAHVHKASVKGNTKGASHTQALDKKGASHTQVVNKKGASPTQASEGRKTTNSPHLSPSESKDGASNTPVPNLTKVSNEDGKMAFSPEEKSESLKGKKRTKFKRRKNRWPPL